MSKAKLVGKRFGKWTVVSKEPNNKRNEQCWLCVCDCGTKRVHRSAPLLQNKTLQCKECFYLSRRKQYSAELRLFSTYKTSAKVRKLNIELTFEQFRSIIGRDCWYCGSKPSKRFFSKRRLSSLLCSGVDRKNNTDGYTLENSLPCCWECNERKRATNYDYFINWIKKVSENLRKEGLWQ
jgi:hypothetical protein